MYYFIILIVIILISNLRKFFINNKQIYLNNMQSIYDRMELYIASNNMVLDNKLIEFMKSHKNLIVNYNLVDIQIFLLINSLLPKTVLENSRNEFSNIKKNLPNELVKMSIDFNNEVNKSMRLSLLKVDYLWLVVNIIIKSRIKSVCVSFKDVMNKNIEEIFYLDSNNLNQIKFAA